MSSQFLSLIPLLSYWHKMTSSQRVGLTSEMAGLATYIVGALVYHEHFWVASSLAIADSKSQQSSS